MKKPRAGRLGAVKGRVSQMRRAATVTVVAEL
ncbi:hypothetical protein J3A78_003511 [Streptomyces sp. PvR006]|nr:hypothetical protein [Streptomyces sp. PvR006]